MLLLYWQQLYHERLGDLFCQLYLHGNHIGCRTIVAAGPDLTLICCFEQMCRHTQPGAITARSSGYNIILGCELTRDLLQRLITQCHHRKALRIQPSQLCN